MNKNVLNLMAVIVGLALIGTFIFGGMVLDRLADKVIKRMEKPYSPSPYGPGIDPDRLDGHYVGFSDQQQIDHSELMEKVEYSSWIKDWERSRKDF